MNKKDKTINAIRKILKDSPLDFEPIHADLTLKWVLKIKPDADDALQIAAFGHDIDRAVYKITETTHLKDYSEIDQFKKEHAARSAKVMKKLLEKESFDKELIAKVVKLIENHEVGGDEEANILTDADSIAYFDYNIYEYMEKNGPERTKNKVEFMYSRLSDRAKKIVKSLNYKDPEIKEIVKKVCSD